MKVPTDLPRRARLRSLRRTTLNTTVSSAVRSANQPPTSPSPKRNLSRKANPFQPKKATPRQRRLLRKFKNSLQRLKWPKLLQPHSYPPRQKQPLQPTADQRSSNLQRPRLRPGLSVHLDAPPSTILMRRQQRRLSRTVPSYPYPGWTRR